MHCSIVYTYLAAKFARMENLQCKNIIQNATSLHRVFVGGATLPMDSKYVPVVYTFATVNSTILLVVTAVTTDLPITQAIVVKQL